MYVQVGAGAAVGNGQRVQMRYTGKLQSGKIFDSNADGGKPFTFQLGILYVLRCVIYIYCMMITNVSL